MKNFESKLNFKLINLSLIFLVILLFWKTISIWGPILVAIKNILLPFLIAFAIAYAIYPIINALQNRGMRKSLSIFFVLFLLFCFIGFIVYLLIPVLIEQLNSLFSWLIDLIPNISKEYNINLSLVQEYIGDFSNLFGDFSKSLGDISITVFNKAINVMTVSIISLIVSISLIIDMDNIRGKIRTYLLKKGRRTYNYIRRLDYEMSQYCLGLGKYIIIQFIEYTIIFFLIGHPYYLLLGILCSITTIIPYFGGIFANIIACITSFFISRELFILTLIVALICPNIDGYIISPRIYSKTNKVPALLTIFAVYAGGKIYGIIGIVIALPLTIVLLATYHFYKEDINKKIDDLKSA